MPSFILMHKNRLAIIHQRPIDRQTGQDRQTDRQTEQRSDSTWRTVFGRPFLTRFVLCYQTVVCLSVYPVCNVGVRGQTVGWIKMKLGLQVGLGPGHTVRWGPNPLPQKGAEPPIVGPYMLWQNDCMDQDATWQGGMPQPPNDIVLDGDPAPQKRYRTAPDFWPICCGQTAGRIKTPRGTVVDLGPGHIMLGTQLRQLPLERGTAVPPLFGPCRLWPNGSPSQLLLSTCTCYTLFPLAI